MRITIVLGAGGPAGHAFHAGMLHGLHEALGWDARHAQRLIGTSAGAQVAALLRAGLAPSDLAARVTGAPLSADGSLIAQHFIRPDYAVRPSVRTRRWMASPRLILPALLRGQFGVALSGLLPEGLVDLSVQALRLRDHFGSRWPERELWINALCLHTGRRVTFGHPTGPEVDVGTAVASSGAIPSVCRPISTASSRYVDGGFSSLLHLDLVSDDDSDLIIVSSPLSRFAPIRWRAQAEVRALKARGLKVLLLQPDAHTSRAIGWNPMALHRAPGVCLAAREQIHRVLSDRSLLPRLPSHVVAVGT